MSATSGIVPTVPRSARTASRPWARATVAAALIANAAVHAYLAPMHFREAPYAGVLFALLTAACLLLSWALVACDRPVVWLATALVSGAGLIALVISRTVGLPSMGDDIGEWADPLVVITLGAEIIAVSCSLLALAVPPRHRPAAS